MKRKDIQTYLTALDVVSEVKGVKFAFTVLKNKKKINEQIEEDKEIIKEILVASDDFKEFEAKRIEICENHCVKNDKGVSIINDGKYDLIDDDIVEKKFNSLKKTYKSTILDRDKQLAELEEIMADEINISFIKLTFDDLPEDLTEKQLESIEFMLNIE